MKIHEYQAKAILKKFGVAVPNGLVACTVEEVRVAVQKLAAAANGLIAVKVYLVTRRAPK